MHTPLVSTERLSQHFALLGGLFRKPRVVYAVDRLIGGLYVLQLDI